MTDLRKAAEMALEALIEAENHNDNSEKWRRHLAAKDALRQALAQPEQEPVAWVRDLTSPSTHCVTSLKYLSIADTDAGVKYIPVYTAPVSKPDVNQELVEALQEMVSQFDQFGLIDCEERAIKEARAALAKHKEQE